MAANVRLVSITMTDLEIGLIDQLQRYRGENHKRSEIVRAAVRRYCQAELLAPSLQTSIPADTEEPIE